MRELAVCCLFASSKEDFKALTEISVPLDAVLTAAVAARGLALCSSDDCSSISASASHKAAFVADVAGRDGDAFADAGAVLSVLTELVLAGAASTLSSNSGSAMIP